MQIPIDILRNIELIESGTIELVNDLPIPTEPIRYTLNGKELQKFISPSLVSAWKKVQYNDACPQKFFLENFDYEYMEENRTETDAMKLGKCFEAAFNGSTISFEIPKTKKGEFSTPYTRAIKAGSEFKAWLDFFITEKFGSDYKLHTDIKVLNGAFKGVIDVAIEFQDTIVVLDLKFTTGKVGTDAYGENSWNTDAHSRYSVRNQIGRKGQAILYPYLTQMEFKKPVGDFYFIIYQQTPDIEDAPIGHFMTAIKMQYSENEKYEYMQMAAKAHQYCSESDFAPKGSFSECKNCSVMDCPNRVLFNEFIL